MPDLHFDVIGVYRGESTLVINYRNHRGELVNEVLTFDGDLVREGHGSIWLCPGDTSLWNRSRAILRLLAVWTSGARCHPGR